MKFESLCDFQEAKQAAKRIFEKYRNGNTLGHTGIGAMMRDTYFNIQQGWSLVIQGIILPRAMWAGTLRS